MRKTIEVVDDFHLNPKSVRQRVIATAGSYQWSSVDDEALSRVVGLLGSTPEQVTPGPEAGRTIVRLAGEPGDGTPRAETADWVAVVFLATTPPPGAGMSFWRERDTGTGGHDRWFESAFIPVRFNRMVLFRPLMLRRTLTAGFGSGLDDGWLSQEYDFTLRPVEELVGEETTHAQ